MDTRPDIFDRSLRARRRDRMRPGFAAHDFLHRAMLDELLERLGDVQRDLPEALLIGCPDDSARAALEGMGKRVACVDPAFLAARKAGGVQADEDVLPFADASFALVLACGTLASVNALPGALVHARHALEPGGMMIAQCLGAGTLPALRQVVQVADGARTYARIHPQIDRPAARGLMSRAGFAKQVVDSRVLRARYRELDRLIADLREQGLTGSLADAPPSFTSSSWARAQAGFEPLREEDGKVTETFEILSLTGWG